MNITCFKNCKILLKDVLVKDDLWVRNGLVIDPMQLFYKEKRLPDRIINCQGMIAAPGFIDIQVNG